MLPRLLSEITVKSIIFQSFLHREKLQYNITVDIQNTPLLFEVKFLNVTGEIQISRRTLRIIRLNLWKERWNFQKSAKSKG